MRPGRDGGRGDARGRSCRPTRRRIGDDRRSRKNAQRLQASAARDRRGRRRAIEPAASRLAPRHCVTGISGRQPEKCAERLGAGDREPREVAAMAACAASSRASLSSVTAWATSRPPGFRRARSCRNRRVGDAATDEDGVGRRQIGERLGALPSRMSRPGTPSAAALRGGHARGARLALERDRRDAAGGAHPFDADRAAAGADIPRAAPRMRHELGERERAHLALGQLAVMLEGVVRQARARKPDARPAPATHSIASVWRSAVSTDQSRASASTPRLLRAAHMRKRRHAAFAKTARQRASRGDGRRRRRHATG